MTIYKAILASSKKNHFDLPFLLPDICADTNKLGHRIIIAFKTFSMLGPSNRVNVWGQTFLLRILNFTLLCLYSNFKTLQCEIWSFQHKIDNFCREIEHFKNS